MWVLMSKESMRVHASIALAAGLLAGCVALLDLQEIVPVGDGEDGSTTDGRSPNDDGGIPTDGTTAPPVDATACEGGACTTRLLTKPAEPVTGLAVSPAHVYWLMSKPQGDADIVLGSMQRCAKAGCDQGLATVAPFIAGPHRLSVDGDLAAWLATSLGNEFPVACSLADCSTSLVPYDSTGARDVAARGGAIVWSDPPATSVRQAPLNDSGTSTAITTTASPALLVHDGTRVVFAETSPARLRSCLRTACSPITLTNATNVRALSLAGNEVVFVDDAGLRVVAADGSGTPRVLRAVPPDAMTAEPGAVYFASRAEQSISRCSTANCASPAVMAGALPNIAFMTVDATSIYAASAEAIYVIAKP
jgi:hypothetical protein